MAHLPQQLARPAVDRLITADQVASIRGEAWALEQRNAYPPFVDLIGV